MTEIMDNIATTIRDRYMMKREVQTLTAQGRISGWIVGLLPFFLAVVLSLINPKYMNLLLNNHYYHQNLQSLYL